MSARLRLALVVLTVAAWLATVSALAITHARL